MTADKSKLVTFVSELLAALSIVASGATYMYQTLWIGRSADLKATVVSSTPKMVSLMVTNVGGRDAVVSSAEVKTTSSSPGGGVLEFTIRLKVKEEGELIRKGEAVLLVAPSQRPRSSVVKIDKYRGQGSQAKWPQAKCLARVEYLDSSATTKAVEAPFDCYALTVFRLPEDIFLLPEE